MGLKYYFPTPYKGARKEGIMLSEASTSLYFERPKKGAERVNYDGVIRYLGTPIKQINPNKKCPMIAYAITEQRLKMWQRRRDLNPRAGCPTYRISSADPSASWVLLRALRRSLKKSFINWLHSSARMPACNCGSWFSPGWDSTLNSDSTAPPL